MVEEQHVVLRRGGGLGLLINICDKHSKGREKGILATGDR